MNVQPLIVSFLLSISMIPGHSKAYSRSRFVDLPCSSHDWVHVVEKGRVFATPTSTIPFRKNPILRSNVNTDYTKPVVVVWMHGIPGNAVLSGFMEKEEMDRQVKPTTRLHTPERRVKVKN